MMPVKLYAAISRYSSWTVCMTMTRIRARLDLRLDVVRYGASQQFRYPPIVVHIGLEAHLETVCAAYSRSQCFQM